VEAELFHTDGRTDRRGEANSRFSQLFERAYKPNYKWKNSENTVSMTAVPFSPLHIPLRPMSTGRLSIAKNIANYCVDRWPDDIKEITGWGKSFILY